MLVDNLHGLPEVVSNHLELDLHLVEGLAVVHAHDGPGHLGDDNYVPK